MAQVCDYLVIGAGSAGCVLANRLSEDPGCRVVLLEAGGSDALTLNRVPGMLYQTVTRPSTNWGYQTEPQEQMHGRRVPWARGKRLRGGQATAYVCERGACKSPTGDPLVLTAQLAEARPYP